MNTLAEYFSFRPCCPEMAIGLGVPRPTVRLTRHEGAMRLTGGSDTGLDLTDASPLAPFPDDYIDKQYYMASYPEELMLRNMI